jgi:hypothetical protein
MAVATRPTTLDLSDFSGGLNVRDGFAEVASNELRDGTLNWTLDERAAITARKGCPVAANFAALAGNPITLFWWSGGNWLLAQVGVTLYASSPGGAWVSKGTFGNSNSCSYAEFNNMVVIVHPTDGVFTFTGAAIVNRSATVKGKAIAAWQNKVWVASDTTPRIWWSNAGDATTWTTATDFVDLREKDDLGLTALFGGPTLVAFKETSHYRIKDSTTGAFDTVDWNAGAVGPRAVVGGTAPAASGLIQEGGIYFFGRDGLYAGDGLRPAISIGDKLRPRFLDRTKLNSVSKLRVCAGVSNGRLYFAYPKTLTTASDTIIEYDPIGRWLLEHQIGSSQPICFATATYTGTPDRQVTLFANFNGSSLIELMTSNTRTDYDGSSVALTLKTGFIPIAGGLLARMRRAFFILSATVSSAVTFAASYLDDYDGAEKSIGLTFGALTVSAGTSRTPFNASGRASAFSFTITASGIAITLRRILAKFYPVEY